MRVLNYFVTRPIYQALAEGYVSVAVPVAVAVAVGVAVKCSRIAWRVAIALHVLAGSAFYFAFSF